MGYKVIISKLANRFLLWVRKSFTCAHSDPTSNSQPMIEYRNKEFLEGGGRRGEGARNSGRCDFNGLVSHEFYNIKYNLQSSQIMSSIRTTPSFDRTITHSFFKASNQVIDVCFMRRIGQWMRADLSRRYQPNEH